MSDDLSVRFQISMNYHVLGSALVLCPSRRGYTVRMR